ncbi:MAG: hypothetical protein C5B51_15785 [Terriglobia bacterium]|nr:MAG: hypothetical protein C5B51_15785 [Terriglobia bacterium]
MMKSIGLAAAVAVLGANLLTADLVVYDNGSPDQTTGDEMTHLIQSEDFVLGANATITDVIFWALDSSPSGYQGTITWVIAADSGGAPGAALASGSTTATVTGTGNTVVIDALARSEEMVSFSIPAFAALAGTKYWLELHNGPAGTTDDLGYFWETSSTFPLDDLTPGQEILLPGGDLWSTNGNEHAFQLVEAVPEPTEYVLLFPLTGLALFMASRRNTASDSRPKQPLNDPAPRSDELRG